MKYKIAPSMMCADIIKLSETLSCFEKAGIEYLHIDVMDGQFVPNFALGTDYIKRLGLATNIPLDIHLMVTCPEQKLDYFCVREGDIISFHIETTPHANRLVSAIKAKGAKAFVALCPSTPLSAIEELLPDLDGVLVMTVNPGFAGQKMIPSCLDKIARLKKIIVEKNLETLIEVDGNVSNENAIKMKNAGADIFVAGTASVFGKNDSMENNIASMRKALGE